MNIEIIDTTPEALHPTRATALSAGIDLRSAESGYIQPGGRVIIGTGVSARFPAGYCGMICSRSGLAIKNGIIVLNAPGIVDEDYRGEIKVILFNSSGVQWKCDVGDRIAQLLLVPVGYPGIVYVSSLDATGRGSDGFGSTGR